MRTHRMALRSSPSRHDRHGAAHHGSGDGVGRGIDRHDGDRAASMGERHQAGGEEQAALDDQHRRLRADAHHRPQGGEPGLGHTAQQCGQTSERDDAHRELRGHRCDQDDADRTDRDPDRRAKPDSGQEATRQRPGLNGHVDRHRANHPGVTERAEHEHQGQASRDVRKLRGLDRPGRHHEPHGAQHLCTEPRERHATDPPPARVGPRAGARRRAGTASGGASGTATRVGTRADASAGAARPGPAIERRIGHPTAPEVSRTLAIGSAEAAGCAATSASAARRRRRSAPTAPASTPPPHAPWISGNAATK